MNCDKCGIECDKEDLIYFEDAKLCMDCNDGLKEEAELARCEAEHRGYY